MKVAINLFSYDGVNSWYCGVGTMTINFINAMPEVHRILAKDEDEVSFNVITPFTTPGCLGYREGFQSKVRDKCHSLGGDLYFHSDASDGRSQFGSYNNWYASSIGASSSVIDLCIKDQKSLHINYLFDTPYCGVAEFVEKQMQSYSGRRPYTVWVPHSTGRIHETKGVKTDEQRYEWEKSAVGASKKFNNSLIGYINSYLKDHLVENFGADKEMLIPLINGIVEDKRHKHSNNSVFTKYGITNSKLVVAAGRAEAYKGFDALLKAFAQSQHMHDASLLLFASSYTSYAPSIDKLKKMFNDLKIRGDLVEEFIPQEDLATIIRSNKTSVAVIPSRGEPFGMGPVEYWSWAQKNGPVILVSETGGLLEQVKHGENGMTVNIDNSPYFAQRINDAVACSPKIRQLWTKKGKELVSQKYDYVKNIVTSIKSIKAREK